MTLDPRIVSEDVVLEILDAALQSQIEHKTIMSWTGEGTSGTFQFAERPAIVIRACNIFLKKFDPETYGPYIKRKRMICW